ncbi:glycerate kinase-like [Daktulosphaira vitifoliae]|uniref:glycerate kinase-like n=1 Tax=Daktulosphaira vitifoliae TaxID=58002 RepID=UPI0021AAA6CC|nr:glycerate kinase-like [Daktulosphaira vitifoliae]XP_050547678.1 glycerate kinase-like [Daktulosphaira vitifoliae]XP_050547679.1 glycerate kinase-like [Daktulosphaira vitifoliae]XP_050547680.1 glycerate kinase-like [Daktulosphaira vitifoliae]XP_050547681.1 glycerate kinase-like [Daktulosphaira vitifoliae]
MNEMKKNITNIFQECIMSVIPRNIIRNSVTFRKYVLCVNNIQIPIPEKIYMVGFGKAVLSMALEMEKILDGHLKKAVLSVPFGTRVTVKDSVISVLEGAENNIPDQNAVNNTNDIKNFVKSLNPNDVLIVLISGGGSALLSSPTVPLSDKICAINLLGSCGASINQLNSVRKALSNVKGGRFIKFVNNATVVSLILSDIIGDPMNAIASGPTVLNEDSNEVPLKIIKNLNVIDKLPKTVLDAILKNKIDTDIDFTKVHNIIVGNNKIALNTGVNKTTQYVSVLLSDSIQGNIKEVSKLYSNLIKFICKLYLNDEDVNLKKLLLKNILTLNCEINLDDLLNKVKKASQKGCGLCLFGGGETTVILKGNGIGGRNQELALRTSIDLDEINENNFDIMFFSGGTDGIDGPTDACGAFGYPNLLKKAVTEGLDPLMYIINNDSYTFYSKFNNGLDLLKIGHTGTNVMDLQIIIIDPKIKSNK